MGRLFSFWKMKKVLEIEFQKLRLEPSVCKTMSTPTKIGMDIGVKHLHSILEIDVNLGVKSGGYSHQGGNLWFVRLVEDA